ncbi:SRPBCC family protein [Sciscionella marina]|uniref:SRPBCC family protein n=1 Tax=Sciscionella marina TaxID=508770 RepID=UPI000379965F|nr:SRPBCC family protein [Sciscionella marina]
MTVTGAHTEVCLRVGLPVDQLWALVTDVPSYGRWSRECVRTEWLEAGVGAPKPGDRFAGHNEFGNGFSTDALCEVTEVGKPHVFAWSVLDGNGDAGSLWRYALTPEGGRTLLSHDFRHGSGHTVARELAAGDPGFLERRLAELRANMQDSLAAMLHGVGYQEVSA